MWREERFRIPTPSQHTLHLHNRTEQSRRRRHKLVFLHPTAGLIILLYPSKKRHNIMMFQFQGKISHRRAAAATAVAKAANAVAAASSSSSLSSLPSSSLLSLTTAAITTRGTLVLNNIRFSSSSCFKYDAPWLNYSGIDSTPSIMNFINGNFENQTPPATPAAINDSTTIPIYNPATNQLLSCIPESSPSSNSNVDAANVATAAERAILAAKSAYPSWSQTPIQIRQRLLLEYAHLLHKKEVREEIA